MSLQNPWRVLCVLVLSSLVDCGACHGDVQHPQPGEPNTVAYCGNASSQESNCMACTAKPGCGFCPAAVSGAPICQPGVKDNNMPGTCSVPLILGSPDCPAPPPPLE
jgi:hypothetical protein